MIFFSNFRLSSIVKKRFKVSFSVKVYFLFLSDIIREWWISLKLCCNVFAWTSIFILLNWFWCVEFAFSKFDFINGILFPSFLSSDSFYFLLLNLLLKSEVLLNFYDLLYCIVWGVFFKRLGSLFSFFEEIVVFMSSLIKFEVYSLNFLKPIFIPWLRIVSV